MDKYAYKVGIVVPSYNQGKYLKKALKSIIENMRYISIKLVVMDGGSKDNSVDIIKNYEQYIAHWESSPDGGQAAAINKGVKYLIDCKYIMWLNSDDEYACENSVYRIVERADETGAAVCYGKSYFIDKDSNKIGIYQTRPFNRKRLNVECYLSQPSVLVRMDAWRAVGGLDERLKMCLDYEMWIRLAKRYDFVYVDEFVGNTRMYEETKTSTMQERHLAEAICILQKQFGYVPMRWISAQWLNEKGYRVKKKIFLYALHLFLLPVRDNIIKKMKDNCTFD